MIHPTNRLQRRKLKAKKDTFARKTDHSWRAQRESDREKEAEHELHRQDLETKE